MTSVYMVSEGSYSDYRVSGIFSTRERAERWMKTCGGSCYNDIEEMPLDEGLSEIERGLALFSVEITKSGSVRAVRAAGDPASVGRISWWTSYDLKRTGNTYTRTEYAEPDQYTTVCVWAEDQQHAIKIANERRIIALATPGKVTP
jgi:hypothetical protein